jgi:hypothetical protein
MKLHANEGFVLSWRHDHDGDGDGGRSSIWINPDISLSFRYADRRKPTLNPAWIEALVRAANTPEGMLAGPEPS